jgi:hypothetical protein
MAEQIVNQPNMYVRGFPIVITGDATLTVGPGQCRDSTNTFDMALDSTVTINAGVNGLNGLDKGTLQINTVYSVFLVSDPQNGNPTGAVLSESLTAPTLPYNYSAFRLIGFATADIDADLLPALISGNDSYRRLTYYVTQATGTTAGSSTAYVELSMGSFVPAINNTPVYIQGVMTPASAGNILYLRTALNVGDEAKIYGQVASVPVAQIVPVITVLEDGFPKISYKVTNASDAAAINVYGYEYYL